MKQTVIERPIYQEQQSSHLHTWRDGAADRIGTHFQHPYQSGDSRRLIRRDIGGMNSDYVACGNHEFLTDRSYQGLPYLDSEITNSVRPTHYWNEQQRREIETASRIPGSRAGYVDNNCRTSEFPRFHTENPHLHVRSPEQLPRIMEASYDYGLGDGHSAFSSRRRDAVNPHDYLLTGSFPIEPRIRPPLQYFPRGGSYQAAPPVTLQPGSAYERASYDLDRQHHQVATSTSSDLHFDRGSIGRDVRCHEVRPPQAVHVSGVPSSYVGVNAHKKGWAAKEQFVRDSDIASESGSSKRKRSRPASTFGDDQLEPQVNFTRGRRRKEQFASDRVVASRSKSSERERSRKEQFACDRAVASRSKSSERERSRKEQLPCDRVVATRSKSSERNRSRKEQLPCDRVVASSSKSAGRNRSRKEQFACDRVVASRSKSSEREKSQSAICLVGGNQCTATCVTQEHETFRDDKVPSNECKRTESGLTSTNDFLDKEIKEQSVIDGLQPNILNQNGDKLATDVDTFEKGGEGNRSFKRQRSSSSSPLILEDNDHCLTLNNKEHLKADTTSGDVSSHEGCDSIVMAADGHQELTSPKLQLGQCFENSPHSATAVLSKKDDVSATNGKQCILTDEQYDVPVNTTMNVLKEVEIANPDLTLSDEVNEELDETMPIVKTKSKKIKRRRKSKSSKQGVGSMTEQVTDISFERLPLSSTGVTSLDNVNATGDIMNTTPVVLENDVLEGVNIELNLEVNEKCEETSPIVKTNSRKKKRKSKSSKSGVGSMTEEVTDISSKSLPLRSMGVTSLDLEKETEHILNTTPVVLEKDAVDGVNINSNRAINGNFEDTKPIVKTKAKIKKRVCKSKSPKRAVGSMTEEATDISSERLALSSVGGTCLAHENVVSVAGVPNDLSTSVPQNDVFTPVSANDQQVDSDLTSSLLKYNMSPANTMLVVLENVEMAGPNVDLSQECETPDETKCLQNTTAVVPENNEITGVNVDLNDEVDAKSEDTKAVAKKAKKKKKRRSSSSKSDGEAMTEEITDPSCPMLPVSSVAGTSSHHKSVTSVLGVTDVVSTSGFLGSDDIRDVMANDRPVESEFASVCEKNYISQPNATLTVLEKGGLHGANAHLGHVVTEKLEETECILNTTVAVLEKDELAVADFELNDEVNEILEEAIPLATVNSKKRKSKQQSPSSKSALESDLKSASVQQDISPVNTTMALLEKDEVAGMDVDLGHVVNEKLEETKHPPNATSGVLEKDEMAEVDIVLNHGMNDEPKEAKHESVVPVSRITDAASINDWPRADVIRYMMANYGPFESEFARACEKYFISRANATMSVLEKGRSHGENAHLSPEVNEKLEETKHIVKTTDALSENEKLAGVTIDLSHKVNERLEETMLPVKSKSKKRKIKQPEEKDEMAGVDIDLNHEMNDKHNEAKPIVNTSSKTSKKLRSSSSKCDVESVTSTPSLRLQTDSTQGAASNHESGIPVSVVTDGVSITVPNTDIVKTVVANEHPVQSRRKLLVLDVNGLLADIVADFPPRYKPDFKLSMKGVFKRPFCDEFLNFCFENFDVGIWSSRTRINLSKAVDVFLGDNKNKLLFCWDKSHCTETGFNTLENFHKPLVLKELTKLWEKKDNNLPWQRGYYNESNTILLDDSPYKALRNPPFTAVFPHPYSFSNVKDTSLGPNGDLRLYLERLAQADNVQHFIEANPFGQKSITQTNPSWSFYSRIAAQHVTQQEKGFASTSSGHSFPKRRRVIYAS